MPQYYDSIPKNLEEWALAQPLFFTASAPIHNKYTHVNVSPKGLPSASLSVFDPNHAAYIDGTGSGCETISHAYENGRVTVMFCSFEKSPRILRWFCRARVVEWDNPRFHSLLKSMGKDKSVMEGARAVILLDVFKVQTSCGYGVPLFNPASPPTQQKGPNISSEAAATVAQQSEKSFAGDNKWRDRDTMANWAHTRIERNELLGYQAANNAASLDGLPGLRTAIRENGQTVWINIVTAKVRNVVLHQWEGLLVGFLGALVLMLVLAVTGWVVFGIWQSAVLTRAVLAWAFS